MGINATYQATTSYTGAGLGLGAAPVYGDSATITPVNTSAPPPAMIVLGAGSTTQVPVPAVSSGFTFTRAHMTPMGGVPSTNVKTLKYNLADAGSANWTAGSVTIPIAPGGSLYIASVAVETIGVAFS